MGFLFGILQCMSKADERHDISVNEYLQSFEDDSTRNDALAIFEIMRKISGEEPILYGIGTIGFGVYKYRYESGRKGEAHTLAFYPRKAKITIYLMDGTQRYAERLAQLGKHSTTGYCIYIKRLSDIDVDVLARIIKESFTNISTKAIKGPIDKILWKDGK